jgi:hypothetical protein
VPTFQHGHVGSQASARGSRTPFIDRLHLGGITKRGDTYLRSLLIQGAKSAVMSAHKRSDPISQWVAALRDRAGWQKTTVALANKNARILWAVMTKGEDFDARHVSVKPGAPMSAVAAA